MPGHISPILEKISVLHNFTIESQVHFYASLAFQPSVVIYDDHEEHGLMHEDLKVFVNSAEWTLG